MSDSFWLHASWAGRLVLARMTGDFDAELVVAEEIGDCLHCWRAVASHLVEMTAADWTREHGEALAAEKAADMIAFVLDKLEAEQP